MGRERFEALRFEDLFATATSTHNDVMKRLFFLILLACAISAHAQRIGEVDTVFKFIGPDHKIVVDAYDDPEVK